MGSIGHPCRTIQGPAPYLSFMTVQALRGGLLLLPCWTNNLCLRPGLNVVIKPYKLALLSTASIVQGFLYIGIAISIGKMKKRRHNLITLCPIDRTITIFVT